MSMYKWSINTWKKCSTLLFQGIQIKAILRFHFILEKKTSEHGEKAQRAVLIILLFLYPAGGTVN